MTRRGPGEEELADFLCARHGNAVEALEPLRGGYWSNAFGYRCAGRELVLRLGESSEGFEMDRAAHAFGRLGLPVPEVLEIGEAFEGAYAISVRHFGRFLEDASPADAPTLGPTLMRTLAALRTVRAEPGAPSAWFPADAAPDETWHHYLLQGLDDDPARTVHGWRARLAQDPEIDALFETAAERVRSLIANCPERRDLVHGDLLHQNVLISEDASEVTAVFSWKCSARGDFLYDTAWCSFWEPWHPGIAAVDVWQRTLEQGDLDADALAHASLRHHCYELQIGATHLAWSAWTGDDQALRAVADHTRTTLERGPRS